MEQRQQDEQDGDGLGHFLDEMSREQLERRAAEARGTLDEERWVLEGCLRRLMLL